MGVTMEKKVVKRRIESKSGSVAIYIGKKYIYGSAVCHLVFGF